MIKQRQVTRAMLETAQARGMCVKEAADHFGFHRVTVSRAAKKAGFLLITEKQKIKLANAEKRAREPAKASGKISCHPSAIAKALAAKEAHRAAKIGAKP